MQVKYAIYIICLKLKNEKSFYKYKELLNHFQIEK